MFLSINSRISCDQCNQVQVTLSKLLAFYNFLVHKVSLKFDYYKCNYASTSMKLLYYNKKDSKFNQLHSLFVKKIKCLKVCVGDADQTPSFFVI